jgi:hypothetical protein
MAVEKSSPLENHDHLELALDRRLQRLGLADNPGKWTERLPHVCRFLAQAPRYQIARAERLARRPQELSAPAFSWRW